MMYEVLVCQNGIKKVMKSFDMDITMKGVGCGMVERITCMTQMVRTCDKNE